jgi:tRNA G10  N-methylase Trm11
MNDKYFYEIRYTAFEKALCEMEMKYLFGKHIEGNFFFSDFYIDPSRSPFIKKCISIIYTGDTLSDIVQQIKDNNLSFEQYKIRFLDTEGKNYEERLKALYTIGYDIKGTADMHNPKIFLGLSRFAGQWIFGTLEDNRANWLTHNIKLYSYCNALGVRVAKALVNIAAGNNLNCKLVDPCCGIGTVVIEALAMGFDIKGYELNPLIAENAKRNLEFFALKDAITEGDMHEIKDHYDCAIVDIPYGHFNPTTLEIQTNIFKTVRRIADRSIFITNKEMDEYLLDSGFRIIDKCYVAKGSFRRYITVCC